MRHIALNTLLSIKNKLHKYDEEVIVAFDNRNYWRKTLFPLYKKHREKDKEESSFDWTNFYIMLDQLKEEFRTNLPFKILEVETAEADDIIATLCQEYKDKVAICISSSDKDFLQLHDKNVVQYSPWHKAFLTKKNTEYDLFTHIVKGDKGDNVPPITADDDVYLCENKRCPPIKQKDLIEWKKFADNPEYFCATIDVLKRYERNKKLVDLSLIPDELRLAILEHYRNTDINRKKFFDYLIKHKLITIMERYV